MMGYESAGATSEKSSDQLKQFGVGTLPGVRITPACHSLSGAGGFKTQLPWHPAKGAKGEGPHGSGSD
jgi:hypothetical protein